MNFWCNSLRNDFEELLYSKRGVPEDLGMATALISVYTVRNNEVESDSATTWPSSPSVSDTSPKSMCNIKACVSRTVEYTFKFHTWIMISAYNKGKLSLSLAKTGGFQLTQARDRATLLTVPIVNTQEISLYHESEYTRMLSFFFFLIETFGTGFLNFEGLKHVYLQRLCL